MKSHISDKTALFIGSSYMLEQCLLISLKKFKKIYLVSDDKRLVKKFKKKITLLTFSKLKFEKFDFLFSILNETIISEKILKNISNNSINFHDGPLPRYAGLYSSTFAILNNEKTHGLCWHEIENVIDGGKIYEKLTFKIRECFSAYNIDVMSSFLGIKLFKTILNKLQKNNLKGYSQNLKLRTYYGLKHFKKVPNYGFLNLDKNYKENYKIFRALNFSSQKKNKICHPKLLTSKEPFIIKNIQIENRFNLNNYKKRQILLIEKNFLIIKCKNKLLKITVDKLIKNFKKKSLPEINKKKCLKYFKYGIN